MHIFTPTFESWRLFYTVKKKKNYSKGCERCGVAEACFFTVVGVGVVYGHDAMLGVWQL